MIGNGEKYKVRSKSPNYISCKATQKILKVTWGALNEWRKLFSCLIVEFIKLFLQSQNVQGKAFSRINFKTMAVPFKGIKIVKDFGLRVVNLDRLRKDMKVLD